MVTATFRMRAVDVVTSRNRASVPVRVCQTGLAMGACWMIVVSRNLDSIR